MLAIAVLLIATMWWFPLALLAGIGVHVVREMITAATQQREAARRAAEVVAARADEQQELVLAGDERGVYGEFPPAG